MRKVIGKVRRVVGPLVEAAEVKGAQMLELAEVGEEHLVGEIIHLRADRASIQVYEDTTGLKPGANIYGSGSPLSVELGPGLIGTIYDGIQRPLEVIRDTASITDRQYIQRGVHLPALNREKPWEFRPGIKKGEEVSPGQIIGTVPETELIEHRVIVPPGIKGKVIRIAVEGSYRLEETIAVVENEGKEIEITLVQRWPVRKPRPYIKKQTLSVPLITGQRIIDIFFPVAKGGAVGLPGGFGTGKTITQHQLAKWSDADIIVFIGCGERGNEMTDVLLNFPKLIDPRTKRPLMERTIFVANTSNMPVAAREASIYTGITLAEYYRDMGYHVAVMADSTSRWAEALRELSGRMEEMPAEEGFPAYLPTRLAEFYERAGMVSTLAGAKGSITIIGSVSPPGGDFSEPVTQHTKRFIRCFWALDRELANARHYPSISWLDSYSEYADEVAEWWEKEIDPDWRQLRSRALDLLQREAKLQQVVKLVGPDVLPDSQRLVLETCRFFKEAFFQQSAFDEIDMFSSAEKQLKMLKIILLFYKSGAECVKRGVPLLRLRRLKVYPEITRMKSAVSDEETEKLDDLLKRLEEEMSGLAGRV